MASTAVSTRWWVGRRSSTSPQEDEKHRRTLRNDEHVFLLSRMSFALFPQVSALCLTVLRHLIGRPADLRKRGSAGGVGHTMDTRGRVERRRDSFTSPIFARRHEMGVDPQREAGVGVAQVVGEGPDGLSGVE